MTVVLKPGTRIRFLMTIDEGPDDHAPGRLFATKGELGTIVSRQSSFHDYSVKSDSWPKAAFGADVTEFEVIEEAKETP